MERRSATTTIPHLGDFIEDTNNTAPIDAAMQAHLRDVVRTSSTPDPARRPKVLRMRFGIEMSTDHTLEEVGKQFDVTRERIRQIEAKAIRKRKRRATAVVTQAWRWRASSKSMGGQVVDALGDGLMAMFIILPKAALAAAEETYDSMGASAVWQFARRTAQRYGWRWAGGEVADVGRRVRRCGQRRGLAARPCQQQRPASTAAVLAGLPPTQRGRFPQPRAHAAARGASSRCIVHLLEAQRNPGDTAATAFRRHAAGGGARRHPPRLDDAEPRLQRHRPAGGARTQPAGHLLHRRHARRACMHRIDWHGGTFQLTDPSYNATYTCASTTTPR